jgi:hypothetical protein
MKAYWKSKTIFRKGILIGLLIHLIGCFAFPFASMYSMTASLSKLASRWGIADVPEKLTVFSLAKFMNEMGSEDGYFYMAIIVIVVLALIMQLLGKKRASFIGTFLIWHVAFMFTFVCAGAAQEVPGYREEMGTTTLMYLISIFIYVVSLAGAIMEPKAQAKLAAKLETGAAVTSEPKAKASPIKMDQETVDKIKAKAENIADTSVAVAKKAATAAVKGINQVSAAAKEFVESAKQESSTGTKQTSSVPQPAQTPQLTKEPQPVQPQAPVQMQTPVQPQAPVQVQAQVPVQPLEDDDDMKTMILPPQSISQTGTITGMRGMFTGAQIPIESGESVIIGRAADSCHIILEGQAISRKHCIIQYDGTTGNYWVTDYSANGTYLGNGSKLPKEKNITLSPGSVIWIGNNENIFQ